MARSGTRDVVDYFQAFFEERYHEDIDELAQRYPIEQKSLYIDYEDLRQFDQDLAADVRDQPAQLREYAEEALRLYDVPIDVSLGQAHVRFENPPETTPIPSLRADHRGRLIAVEGVVRDAGDITTTLTTGAYECQRCGTLTRIPQGIRYQQEPHECQGCENQGPFEINFNQSEFIDYQEATIHALEAGEGHTEIEANVEDDLAGALVSGDPVRITGIVRLEERGDSGDFDIYIDGLAVAEITWADLDAAASPGPADDIDVATAMEEFENAASLALTQLPDSVREEETKAKIVTPFVEALGWDPTDPRQVRLEYTDGEINDRPDYALFVSDRDHPVVVIEAKRLGRNLNMEHKTRHYMREYGADWGIFTNGETYRIYETAEGEDRPSEDLVAELDLSEVHQAGVLSELARSSFC